nr:MBOAT family O-acyltransferase [uncultured Sellimonas sp.]
MLLNSLNFIFAFLPVVLILFYVVPGKWKNVVLALASIFFYAWGEPVYVVLMLFSAVLHYMMAIDIGRKQKRNRSAVSSLVFTVVMDVFILCFFKYYGFLSGAVNEWLGTGFSTTALVLPIGLSFYTFKNLSYIIDVYKKKCQPERDPIAFLAYASLFACMSAGPIVRYVDIKEDLYAHSVYMSRLGEGARRFILGLAKKVLLADQLSLMISQIQESGTSMSVVTAWIYLFAYTMQIYFDFSGYSDMAIGVGKMLGFEFKENFDYPYIAKSVTEFWRRWHISLSSWFRDYVYIPLGGNRVSVLCHLRNIIVVWCLTGIWHGGTWNFPMWGLYYAVILIGEKYIWKKLIERFPAWAANTYTMLLVMFGWLIFMNTSWDAASSMFGALFGFGASAFIDVTAGYYLKTGILLFVLCVLAARPVLKKLSERIVDHYKVVAILVYLVLFLLSIGGLVFNSYQPFLYMQF